MSLPIVQHKTTYDLSKMDKHEVIDHVTKLHDTQKEKKDEEVELAATTTKGKFAFIQVEAFAKTMDNNIVHEVIIDLTNTGVMDKTPKACNAALADKVSPQEKTCIQLVHNLKWSYVKGEGCTWCYHFLINNSRSYPFKLCMKW